MAEPEAPLLVGSPLIHPLTTVKLYDPEVKAKAYECFLHTDMDLVDISIMVSVPRHVVATWAKEGEWNKRKRELELEVFRAAEAKYRAFLIKNKQSTVERHLALSTALEEQVGKLLDAMKQNPDDLPSSSELRRLAETLASITAVSGRAVGLAEKVTKVEEVSDPDEKKGKRPLIQIGIGAPKLADNRTMVKVTDENNKVSTIEVAGSEGEKAPDGPVPVRELDGAGRGDA